MKSNRSKKKPAKATVGPIRRPVRAAQGEDHLGATEEQVGDRTGSGAGYDQKDKSSKKPAKGGVST
jgi:hypothetical protein